MKSTLRAAALALVAGAAAATGCAAPPYDLTLDGDRFRVQGSDLRVQGSDLAQGTLVVTVAGSDVALFGELQTEKEGLSFEPRYPLRPGLTYRAVYTSSAGLTAEKSFTLPAPPASAPTVVQAVYPSRDTLPENLLKFYLHFAAPMSRREAYAHVHLKDAAGKDVELPFLEIGEELWDRSTTRLTLLFDPGRIKRGLKPREDSGPALEEGKSYTLVIDPEWPDAEGRPLKQGFRKSFKVVAPDDQQPDPKAWKLAAPRAGGAEPLTVTFEKALDHAMLNRSLGVVDAAGKIVSGRIEIDREETRWRFHPETAWREGKYSLVVDTVLEDQAGNSIERPFEVDIVRPAEREIRAKTVSLPFEPSK